MINSIYGYSQSASDEVNELDILPQYLRITLRVLMSWL